MILLSQLANNGCPPLQASLPSPYCMHVFPPLFLDYILNSPVNFFIPQANFQPGLLFTLSFICMYVHKFTVDTTSKSVPPPSADEVSFVSWLCPQEFSSCACVSLLSAQADH